VRVLVKVKREEGLKISKESVWVEIERKRGFESEHVR